MYFSVHHHDLETAQTGRLPWLIDWRRISAVIAAIAAAQVADLAKQTASMLLDQSNSLECAMGALPIQQPLSFATQRTPQNSLPPICPIRPPFKRPYPANPKKLVRLMLTSLTAGRSAHVCSCLSSVPQYIASTKTQRTLPPLAQRRIRKLP